jgi:hypothetical protein
MAQEMLEYIPAGAMVLLDRNFNAWRFLLGILDRGSHFLVRSKTSIKSRLISSLGPGDDLVHIQIGRHLRRHYPEMPRKVVLREINVRISGAPYRFFTSLLDPKQYPADEIVRLYHQRWDEEMVIDEIKTHQCNATTVNRPLIFRSKAPERVMQEAWGLVLSYNLIRTLILQSAQRMAISPLQLSFVSSLERIRDASLLMAVAPTRALPLIFNDLLDSIARCRLPERRQRNNPRAVCIKMSGYHRKRKAS